jgi:hypothetical protein
MENSSARKHQIKKITITRVESLSTDTEADTEPFSRPSLSSNGASEIETDAREPEPSAEATSSPQDAASSSNDNDVEVLTDLAAIIAEISELDLPESDKITLRNVCKEYHILTEWQKLINEIEEQEVTLDELDNDKSPYIRESFYKRKFFRLYATMCSHIAKKPHLKEFFVNEIDPRERNVDTFDSLLKFRRGKKIKFTMTRYDALNKAIETLLNRPKDPVPDYPDIYDLVSKVNADSKLGLGEVKIEETAKAAFKACVDLFKRRRIRVNTEVMLTRLKSAETCLDSDPAKESRELEERLVENKRQSERKLDEIISEFVEKSAKDGEKVEQQEGEEDEDEDEEEEDDDDEADVTLGSTNCASDEEAAAAEEDGDGDSSFEEIGSENIDDGFSAESRDGEDEAQSEAQADGDGHGEVEALAQLLVDAKQRDSEVESGGETHEQFLRVMKMSPATPKKSAAEADAGKRLKRDKDEAGCETPDSDKKLRRSDEKKARMSESPLRGAVDDCIGADDDYIVLD